MPKTGRSISIQEPAIVMIFSALLIILSGCLNKKTTTDASNSSTMTISQMGYKVWIYYQVLDPSDTSTGSVVMNEEFYKGDKTALLISDDRGNATKQVPVGKKIILAVSNNANYASASLSSRYCPQSEFDQMPYGNVIPKSSKGNNPVKVPCCPMGGNPPNFSAQPPSQSSQTITPRPTTPVQAPQPWTNPSSGRTTRYWDCNKPHCGWTTSVTKGNPVPSCDISNNSNGSNFTGSGYTCYNMAPWAANATLSYGFTAVPNAGDICGKCYELRFTGGGDPGSQKLVGKRMIVQATNVGGDVGSGQFDLLIPGGGVGLNNGCAQQWSGDESLMGAGYGGLLTSCKDTLGWNASLDAYKECMRTACNNLFNKTGRGDLLQGCYWFIDWFEVADNPSLQYMEVACPQELTAISKIGDN